MIKHKDDSENEWMNEDENNENEDDGDDDEVGTGKDGTKIFYIKIFNTNKIK